MARVWCRGASTWWVKRKKKVKPVIPPKPERFLPHVAGQNGQIGRGRATGRRIKRIGDRRKSAPLSTQDIRGQLDREILFYLWNWNWRISWRIHRIEFHPNGYEMKEMPNFSNSHLKQLAESRGWESKGHRHRVWLFRGILRIPNKSIIVQLKR